ncbi:MAG: DUF393 domain-containing protein [Gammaproteobacteria bacterium]|nr:DUF393 domain-containing protein [Gammaproteobacteria bacterium]
MNPTVFYDGGCPICRREIDHYRKLDTGHHVNWQDIHADPAAVEGSGVSFDDAMARLHVLDRHGALRSGADAFTVIWDELPGWRWLSRLVRALRLIGPMEWAYGLWLRRRERQRCPVGNQQAP